MERSAPTTREGVRSSGKRPEFGDDLCLGGEAPLILLREDGLSVNADDEDAAAASNDLAVEAQLFLQRGRQTGGSGKVVSNAAVVDSDVHRV